MIGFSEIRENSSDRLHDVIGEVNDRLDSKEKEIIDPTCPRCGGDASISFGSVEFSTLGFHLSWGRLCKECAEELQKLIMHPVK